MSKLNRHGLQELVDADLEWLRAQPRTLERDHVIEIVKYVMANYHDGSKPPHVWNNADNARTLPDEGRKLLIVSKDGAVAVGRFYGGLWRPEGSAFECIPDVVKWAYIDYLQMCQVTQKSEFDQWRLPSEEPDDGALVVVRDGTNQLVGFFDCYDREVHTVKGPSIPVSWNSVESWAYLYVNHARIHV